MCELVIVSRLTINKSLERPWKNPVPIGLASLNTPVFRLNAAHRCLDWICMGLQCKFPGIFRKCFVARRQNSSLPRISCHVVSHCGVATVLLRLIATVLKIKSTSCPLLLYLPILIFPFKIYLMGYFQQRTT